jgi:hypothetical protein
VTGRLTVAKQRKLATTVYVDGTAYGPDDDVPAAVAEQITNPKAWAAESDAERDDEEVREPGTTSGARLAGNVYVDGQAYGPNDVVPDDVAARITNPKAWEGGKLPAVADGAAASTDGGGDVLAPPRSGAGSAKGAWAAFAEANGVDVPEGASREDIIAACERAQVIESE